MCRTYDLALDSAKLGIGGCVDQILSFTEVACAHKGEDI